MRERVNFNFLSPTPSKVGPIIPLVHMVISSPTFIIPFVAVRSTSLDLEIRPHFWTPKNFGIAHF